jgi:hypothetical protein
METMKRCSIKKRILRNQGRRHLRCTRLEIDAALCAKLHEKISTSKSEPLLSASTRLGLFRARHFEFENSQDAIEGGMYKRQRWRKKQESIGKRKSRNRKAE